MRIDHFHFNPINPKCLDDSGYKYFGRVLHYLEPIIANLGLRIYVTAWTTDELPTYGDKVISFILQDEFGRDAPYRDKVKAIFKTCGTNPFVPEAYGYGNTLEQISNIAAQAKHLSKNVATRIRNANLKYIKKQKLAPVHKIPLGYFAHEDIQFIPFEKREHDLYFAGSIQHVKKKTFQIQSPKEAARNRMNRALEDLSKKYTDIKFKSLLTGGYGESIKTSNDSYLYNMMNTKFCPIPRGANLETFRFYEAIRYGCIPIGESFPNAWYYDDAPLVRLKSWAHLSETIIPLLEDTEKQKEMHHQALAWWRNVCAEEQLAKYIGSILKP